MSTLFDIAFDYFGKKFACCNEEREISIMRISDLGEWEECAKWEAHTATIHSLCWAHPEFGTLLATSSSDSQIILWEEVEEDMSVTGQASGASRWVSTASLSQPTSPVLHIEFAPRYFGLLLVYFISPDFYK